MIKERTRVVKPNSGLERTTQSQPNPAVLETPLPSFLNEMRQKADSLGPAGKKVTEFFLANASRIPDMSITDVARAAKVSEPTVGRICQMLGYGGYREFRIKLARASGGNIVHVHADVGPTDRPSEIAIKVIDTALSSLEHLKDQMKDQKIAEAVTILGDARRIEFYGHGNSGIVAMDAQHKFFRLGIPSIAYNDSHVHVMSASLLGPRDSVICISRSGETTELVRTAEILKERQVPLVSITPADSTLAKLSTVAIHIDFDEDPDVYTPMSSRLGQLVIIDILAVSVAVQRGALASPDMQRARRALKEKRLPKTL
jgi:RpiR family transcriptional regulator, carbohydrate utilization regulator